MVADPAFTLITTRNPGVRVLADLRTAAGVKEAFGADTYPSSVLYAKGEWIRANRDTASQLARAIVRTLQWMHTHSPQEIADEDAEDIPRRRRRPLRRGVEELDADVLARRGDGRARAPRPCGRCSPARWRRSGPRRSTCRKPIRTNSSMDAKTLLFVGLGAMLFSMSRHVVRGGLVDADHRCRSAIGFVTAFFDTLGIGSFATTTAVYKLRNLVPVKLIPGTLNVGHTLPTIAQAFIYTQHRAGRVDDAGADDRGGGRRRVARRRRRRPLAAAQDSDRHGPRAAGRGGADVSHSAQSVSRRAAMTLGLTGARLGIGLAGNFVLGALMMLGIGLYAPCMILVSLLGMNPTAAFPIMMGSCAFLMPISSVQFVKSRTYHVQAALGLALGGLPGGADRRGVFVSRCRSSRCGGWWSSWWSTRR